jgi:hypothetical protein
MMPTLFIFQLTVALLCVVVVFLLGVKGTTPLVRVGMAATTPDVHVALYWVRRTLVLPYHTWYLHHTDAYPTVPLEVRLPDAVVRQGHILFPLHVFYLRFCGQWLHWTHPQLAHKLLSDDSTQGGELAVANGLREAMAMVAAAFVVLVGAPGSWCLARVLTQLLTRAVQERERVARAQLPAATGETRRAASAAEADQAADAALGSARGAPPSDVRAAACFLGALLIVLVGLLPLLVVEVSTLQPWCLVGSLLVWAVYAVLQDELQRHVSEAETTDDAFNLTTPLIEEDAVVFFALKKQPGLKPLVSYAVLATLMSLTLPSCLYLTLVLFLWTLTSCWQHGYKRVLVKVKSAATRGGTTAVADSKDLLRVGYSCYADKLYMNLCFCYASLPSVLTLLAITTPWWWCQQPLLSFIDLFASPPLPSAENMTAAAVTVMGRSFTGARELRADCLSGLTSYYNCALPTANGWQLSEWFGLPWTRLSESLTRFFMAKDTDVARESARWLEFATVVLVVLMNGASVLVLSFYRVRKPPLSFETPLQYAAERAAHQAEQEAYWEAKKSARRGSSGGGDGSQQRPSPSTTAAEDKRAKVVTCLCREEYVVKQAVLLCGMLALAAASCTVLILRNGPASGVASLPCSSLLAAVHAVIAVLRRTHPLAFIRSPSSGSSHIGASTQCAQPVRVSPSQQKPQKEEEVYDPSALTQQDRDDPRPPAASLWCSSAVAPSLAHVADVAWLLLMATATLLSTGALSWPVVPAVLRHGVVGMCGGFTGFALWRLRRWAVADFTSSVLFAGGCVASLLLTVLLVAQLIPQTSAEGLPSLHGGIRYLSVVMDRLGDVYTGTDDAALRAYVYQCAVACITYVSCAVYAALRIGRLAIEPEEVWLVPIEAELNYFSKATPPKKQR